MTKADLPGLPSGLTSSSPPGLTSGLHPATPVTSGLFTGPEGGRSPYALPALGAFLVLSLIMATAWWLHHLPERGASASFSLLIGASLGVIMQRGRFCFFCIFRDLIEERDSRGFYSVLTALAVGSLCYTVIFTVFLANPGTGRFPPDAHIGPVSWALIAAGIAFGVGMALSGACISGHLYRLGEGYSRAPFALVGSVVGFGAGFFSWRSLYLGAISTAPQPWLPHYLGYGGAIALQCGFIALIALLLIRYLPAPAQASLSGGPSPAPSPSGAVPLREVTPDAAPQPRISLGYLWDRIFVQRWSPAATGTAVGVLGAMAYFRVAPLGVTSQIGSIARTALSDAGMLTGRLNGLDTFSGCVTAVIHTISDNGLLISGLTAASLAMAIAGRNFALSRLTLPGALTALLGGVLMGWGSMIALGCTVGTLLSGIMALSVSGWLFFASVFAGVWGAIKLGLHVIGQPKA